MADKMQPCFSRAENSRDQSSEVLISRPIRRVALVTPWAGGNLGNSAIISAVIFNLSQRLPGATFVGVTLNSEQTVRRFGIDAFPLTGASRPYQSQWDSVTAKGDEKSGRVRIKQFLKQVPIVSNVLRLAGNIRREFRHVLLASRLVRHLDCVLVPGGGALDEFWGGPWGHPWNLMKWSALSRIHRVPFIILSVGKCALDRPASRLFVSNALKLANYRSYRDPDSKNSVQSLIHAPDDPVVPDLAFSYPVPASIPGKPNTSKSGGLVVGFSPIAYCDPRVWPLKDQARYSDYLQRLATVVKWLQKRGHKLVFFATDSPDLETINDLISIAELTRESNSIVMLTGPVDQTIDRHLQEMARTDLVVASRLHGVVLSHLAGVPALALSFDPKVVAHMAGVKQMDYCLNIDTFTLDAFVERFEALSAARQLEQSHLGSAVATFRRQVQLQYNHIFGPEMRFQDTSRSARNALAVAASHTA
jgi:polysaccharide pyruvyl transferase WcaK-like protein